MSERLIQTLTLTTTAAVGLIIALLVISAMPAGAGPFRASLPRLTWTQLTPSISPGARAWTSMADDPADGYVVLYGGYTSATGYQNDTWAFYNGTWTKLAPTSTPPSQIGLVLTYDPALHGVVTFGGQFYGNETWLFSAGNWTRIMTHHVPPARWAYAMAYDAYDNEIVMFGGNAAGSSSTTLSDTWVFNGTDWAMVTRSHPAGRAYASMVYDNASQSVLLVGGVNGTSAPLPGTWAFHAGHWSRVKGANTPATRTFAYVAALGNGTPVLFGGSYAHGNTLFGGTFEFVGGSWIRTHAPGAPTPRNNGAIAWDPSISALLVFSGYLGPGLYSPQTWSLG